MQFDHLSILKAVVECKSMNKAAAKLFCTQPTVSAAIKNIENELGYPVIERTPQGIRPTTLGLNILNDATVILESYERWKTFAKVQSSNQPVEITLTGTAPSYNIVSAIKNIQKVNPELKITIRFQHEPGAATSHINGRIGIQYKIPEHVEETNKHAEAIGMSMALIQQDQFVVIANSSNPLAKKNSLSLEDLADQQILLYQNPVKFPYAKKLIDTGLNLSPLEFHESALMAAVSIMRDAVSLRPRLSIYHSPYIRGGELVAIPFTNKEMPVDLYVVYPRKHRIFDSERLFLNELSNAFPLFRELGE